MPKILIIDNDPDWCNDLQNPLVGLGYNIETRSKRDLAKTLIEENAFDLVIVNVWLDNGNKESEVIKQWDDLLREIEKKRIEIIVVTARASYSNVDILLRKAFKIHGVADFIIKEDFNKEEYRRVVVDTIRQQYQKPKIINGREYKLRGVNQQIYSFLAYEAVVPKIFEKVDNYTERLFRSLGSAQYDESLGETKRLLLDLWKSEIGLPPYLFIDALSEFEFNRKYYDGYRDHVTHQLRVFLLGLYLFYGVESLRNAILGEFEQFHDAEEAFLLSWKITSTFHDLGYVFEIENDKSAETSQTVINVLNKFFEYPFWYYCQLKGFPLLESQELMLQEKFNFPRHKVDDLLGLENFRGKNILEDIEDLIQPTQLSRQSDGLQRYFHYAQQNIPSKSSRKESFIDHGIASAITLLHLYNFFNEYSSKIFDVVSSDIDAVIDIAGIEFSDFLKDTITGIHDLREVMKYAATAIALHNIQVDIWDHNEAWRKANLTLNLYNISLEKRPLAFLLCLTDALQDWDRPRFSTPSPSRSYVAQDQDVSISFKDDQILIDFVSDELKGTSKSTFEILVNELKKYMRKEDVDLLLREST